MWSCCSAETTYWCPCKGGQKRQKPTKQTAGGSRNFARTFKYHQKKEERWILKWQKASGGTFYLRHCPPVIHAKKVSDYMTDNMLVTLLNNSVHRHKQGMLWEKDPDLSWHFKENVLSLRSLLHLGLFGTNLSFEVVLPFGRLQSFEASAAVGRHWHTERPMDSGEELGGQGHRARPQAGGFTSTHDEVWTGAWSTQRDRCFPEKAVIITLFSDDGNSFNTRPICALNSSLWS